MTGADEEEELDTGSFYISRKLNNMFLQDQENVIMLNLKTDDFENLFSSLTSKAPLIIAFTNDEDQLIYSNKPLTKTQTAVHGPLEDNALRSVKNTASFCGHSLLSAALKLQSESL